MNINSIDLQIYEKRNAYVNVDDVLSFAFSKDYTYYFSVLQNEGYLYPINNKPYVPENIICIYLEIWGKEKISEQLIDYINVKK